jgi:hypothetical protein
MFFSIFSSIFLPYIYHTNQLKKREMALKQTEDEKRLQKWLDIQIKHNSKLQLIINKLKIEVKLLKVENKKLLKYLP